MKKKIFMPLLTSLLFLSNATAFAAQTESNPKEADSIITYADDNVTFEYNSNAYATIDVCSNEFFVMYRMDLNMYNNNPGYGFLSITLNPIIQNSESEKPWKERVIPLEPGGRYSKVEIINDSDLPEVYLEYTDEEAKACGYASLYLKLLGYTDDSYITISYHPSGIAAGESDDFLKQIYSSASVTDNYLENGYSFDQTDFQNIFSHVAISEQCKNYGVGALQVAEDYLSFAIESDAAVEKLESILDRASDYRSFGGSDYKYDSDVYSAISDLIDWIKFENDIHVMEIVKSLKNLCDIE